MGPKVQNGKFLQHGSGYFDKISLTYRDNNKDNLLAVSLYHFFKIWIVFNVMQSYTLERSLLLP
jgi:hypothetical protein